MQLVYKQSCNQPSRVAATGLPNQIPTGLRRTHRHATDKAQLVRACMVAGRASMCFLDACHWPGSCLVLFIGSSMDSRSCTTAAWCCNCTDHRDHIDSLLACLMNADASHAWPTCRDSTHAFLVVLFAASNSRVCVPDYFSFFFLCFLSVKFFLSLSLTLYIICT